MDNKTTDLMQTKLDEVAKLYDLKGLPKRLISGDKLTRNFTANGTDYILLFPNECFNINRQEAYNNILIAFGTGQTPTQIKLSINEILANVQQLFMVTDSRVKTKHMQSILEGLMNFNESFKGSLTSRYSPALFICTLFIFRRGEDLSKEWDFEDALLKINDWTKENISVHDFFLLAQSLSNECREIISDTLGEQSPAAPSQS